MSASLDLKKIERKAFRSTYQDGLLDMLFGTIVMAMAAFMYRPEEGYSLTNMVVFVVALAVGNVLFWLGKRFVTLPRMGQVRFGPARKQKATTLAIILGLVVLVQVGIVGLTTFGWLNPQAGAQINDFLAGHGLERLAVATVGSLFVGPSLILIAYLGDFPRGYYIAVMMSLAVFLMILLNQPVYALIIGGLVFLPGLVLFIRFLQKYPLRQESVTHD
jgi:hypothetical protein